MSEQIYAGRLVKTSIGNLKIKSHKYTGVGTGPGMSVIKYVSVKTECGSDFKIAESELQKALVD